MHAKQKGLTLVELMVTVAVLAILATIAYPLYTQQAQKSRRTDARVALESIAQAQERFFTVNGTYSAALTALQLGPAVDTCADADTCTSVKGAYQIDLTQPGGATSFLLTATPQGPQVGDDCTTMTVNQLGIRNGTGTGCW